ncbi:Mitochondrial amidoxime reducing component 2 [Plecturocebus cupreus]
MTDASLVDLNTRMEKKVKMENFRPNIVVTGCDAFEEDTWHELLIGSVEMKRVMACARCILTTVDPDTGIIDRKEPLDTLKRYNAKAASRHSLTPQTLASVIDRGEGVVNCGHTTGLSAAG